MEIKDREIFQWRPIAGFDEYFISTNGEIKNIKTNRTLKPLKSGSGGKYRSVILWKNKVSVGPRYIHRLVLETFVGPAPDGKQCAHLDGNPENNKLINLKWVTPKENTSHKYTHGTILCGEKSPRCILGDIEMKSIIALYISGRSIEDLSKKFRVSCFYIYQILNGRRRKYLTSSRALRAKIKTRYNLNKNRAAKENSPWK